MADIRVDPALRRQFQAAVQALKLGSVSEELRDHMTQTVRRALSECPGDFEAELIKIMNRRGLLEEEKTVIEVPDLPEGMTASLTINAGNSPMNG